MQKPHLTGLKWEILCCFDVQQFPRTTHNASYMNSCNSVKSFYHIGQTAPQKLVHRITFAFIQAVIK